ncbi:MAG: sulfotransferase [Planctomycetes bacterium]|nr:sulfotransferase [Planctomycetota bacterium]
MSGADRKPTFFLVGGSRCGTTSLHRSFVRHPGIFMPRDKSPNYFTAPDMADFPAAAAMIAMKGHSITDRDDYLDLFTNATNIQVCGEVSPVYLQSIHTAARIKEFAPEAKIIAILRDPVERAFAHYIGRRRDGLDDRDTFEEAIAAELIDRAPRAIAFNRYMAIGRYAFFLKSFYREFPTEQIKVVFFDDLVRDPVRVVQGLFNFLEVEPLGDRIPMDRRNRGGIIRNPLLRKVWTRTALVRARLRKHLPESVRDLAGRAFLSKIEKPPLDPAIRHDLVKYFEEDLFALKAMCKRHLSEDLVPTGWGSQIAAPSGKNYA